MLPETAQDTVVDEVETKQDGAGTEPAGSVMDEAGKPAEIVVDEADAEPVEKRIRPRQDMRIILQLTARRQRSSPRR